MRRFICGLDLVAPPRISGNPLERVERSTRFFSVYGAFMKSSATSWEYSSFEFAFNEDNGRIWITKCPFQ
jgi:hypothetical protein